MVKKTIPGASAFETNSINLTRMIARLQTTLNTPSSATERRLRSNRFEREKVGTNLEYARSILFQLEQEALNIRVQSKRQETQADLSRRRAALSALGRRLQELNLLGRHDADDASSDGEDVLGEDILDDEDDSLQLTPPATASSANTEHVPSPVDSESSLPLYTPPEPSELRKRGGQAQDRAELFGDAQSTGISTATTEALLSHNRTEQESLTTSLLSMAAQLKQQSRAFAASLEDEKDVLKRATEGLDKNELGLETAQRKMGFLRGYTEGKGWWGRMLMYAWIFGLMIIALLIVFVMPKLRF